VAILVVASDECNLVWIEIVLVIETFEDVVILTTVVLFGNTLAFQILGISTY